MIDHERTVRKLAFPLLVLGPMVVLSVLFLRAQAAPQRRGASPTASASVSGWPQVGFIDHRGDFVIQPIFQDALPFTEDLAAVRSGYKWGYIDKAGVWVIAPQFTQARSFSDGLAAVNIHGRWGFVNKLGTVVVPPKFETVGDFSDDRALVQENIHDSFEYLDLSGNLAFKQTFPEANKFSEGLPAACSDRVTETPLRTRSFWLESGCVWGFINPAGQFVIPPAVNGAGYFSEGLAPVQVGRKWGYIDRAGKMVIKAQFDEAHPFSDGLARVTTGGISGAWFLQEGTAFAREG